VNALALPRLKKHPLTLSLSFIILNDRSATLFVSGTRRRDPRGRKRHAGGDAARARAGGRTQADGVPTILGSGKCLFPDRVDRRTLRRVEARTVGTDGVQVHLPAGVARVR